MLNNEVNDINDTSTKMPSGFEKMQRKLREVDKTGEPLFKDKPDADEKLKKSLIGTFITGLAALPSDAVSFANFINEEVAKNSTGGALTAKTIAPILKKIEQYVGRNAFDKAMTKLGVPSDASDPYQIAGEVLSPTGPLLGGAKLLKKGANKVKDFFDNITPGGGGSGGVALETAGVGKLDKTKKILKDEQKAITTEAPTIIPPDEFINAPKTDKMSMGGKNTPTGAAQIKKYKELDKTKKYNPDELFEMTGVYKGPDGKFRWEIDTSDAQLKTAKLGEIDKAKDGDAFFLSNILTYDRAYQEYFKEIKVTRPSKIFKGQKSFYNYKPLKNLSVVIKNSDKEGALGAYVPASDQIILYKKNLYDRALSDFIDAKKRGSYDGVLKARIESTLLHEIQHAIQAREGFLRGSNTDNFLREGFNKDFKDNATLKSNILARFSNDIAVGLDYMSSSNRFGFSTSLEKKISRLNEIQNMPSSVKIDNIDLKAEYDLLADDIREDFKRINLTNKEKNKILRSYNKQLDENFRQKKLLDKEYNEAYQKYRDSYGEKEARLVQERFKKRLELQESSLVGEAKGSKPVNIKEELSKTKIPEDMKGVTSAEIDRLGKIARTDPVTGKVKPRIAIGKNKGGDIMKKQMELFDEGGLKDEGNTVDPVSGNDVPPGATQEEVRDDIPAQLSEGEFVFPADVVRYLGLEFLMKLRQKAKAGLQRMEDMGQMGNSDEATIPDDAPFNPSQDDLPFTMEDLDMEDEREYNEGGVVKAQTGTYVAPGMGTTTTPSQFQGQPLPSAGNVPNYVAPMIPPPAPAPVGGFRPILSGQTGQTDTQTPTPTFQSLLGRTPGQYDELREYVNEAGMKLRIPFKDGQPIYPIPEGYTFVDPEATKTEEVTTKEVTPQTARVVEDTSSGDDPEDTPTGATDLTGAPLSYLSMPFSKNMDALDKELYDIAFTQTKLFDPREIAKVGAGKVNANDIILSGITQVVDSFKKSFIVGSDFKLGKSHITGENIQLQKGFNLADMLKTDRDDLANRIANRRNEIERAISDRDGNILSMKDLDNKFKEFGIERPKLTGITSQDRKNLSISINKLVVEERERNKKIAEAQRKAGEARGDIIKRAKEREAEAEARRQEIAETNRAMQDAYRQAGFDTITADDGDTGGSFSDSFGGAVGPDGGYATATGGLIPKKKKPKVKKMKRGGLASR